MLDTVKKWAPVIVVSAVIGYGVVWALKKWLPSVASKIPFV